MSTTLQRFQCPRCGLFKFVQDGLESGRCSSCNTEVIEMPYQTQENTVAEPKKPEPLTPMTNANQKARYEADLYTQLVIYGQPLETAAQKAKMAADYLEANKLPFPNVIVG